MKRGRMSNYETQFIKDNVQHFDYKEIARHLEREPSSVKKYIEEKMGMKVSLEVNVSPVDMPTLQYDIEKEDFWEITKEQFAEPALKVFRYQWNQFFEQFGGDVLPTEKLQIIDTIKLEILMNNNLIEQRQMSTSIAELEIDMSLERAKPRDVDAPIGQDSDYLFNLERQVTSVRAAQQFHLRDYRELQDRKNKGFAALKGTRTQRIERIENSRETFLTWMSEIIDNPERRRELGHRMEKMRLATEDEKIRLAAYHKYEDGNVDQPFLNCDTVKEDNGRLNVFQEMESVKKQEGS
jgi:hypothetical protein